MGKLLLILGFAFMALTPVSSAQANENNFDCKPFAGSSAKASCRIAKFACKMAKITAAGNLQQCLTGLSDRIFTERAYNQCIRLGDVRARNCLLNKSSSDEYNLSISEVTAEIDDVVWDCEEEKARDLMRRLIGINKNPFRFEDDDSHADAGTEIVQPLIQYLKDEWNSNPNCNRGLFSEPDRSNRAEARQQRRFAR